MASIRNISTDTLELRYGGRSLGVAEPDATLDVPDEIAKELDFPDTLWSIVTPPAKEKASAKEKA